MQNKSEKVNKSASLKYCVIVLIFGALIYSALWFGDIISDSTATANARSSKDAFSMFKDIIVGNAGSSFATLLIQILVILLTVRIFSFIFRFIGQPGVIGEIVAGIALGPSLLGKFAPGVFETIFPASSLGNLQMLSQLGLILFMFVIGLELDFNTIKTKLNKTLLISHTGILVSFFLGILASIWVYQEYAAETTQFIPFALFIGISLSITAFPVLARIIQERGMTKSSVGLLAITSAANDDVTAWCLLAVVIAIAKAGTFVSSLFTVGLVVVYIAFMFLVLRPFMKKIGKVYASSEVINKSFVGFIFIVLILSSITTEIIGIHALFGAFVAGVVMPPNMGFRKIMMEKIEDVALVLFLPLFFVFTGLRTEVGLINTPALWGLCALFIVLAMAGKIGGCSLGARIAGQSWKESLTIGTLMSTRGLMELVALNIGYEMGILPPQIFVILIIMALVTTFMTTPILSIINRSFHKKATMDPNKKTIMLFFGRPESGKRLLEVGHIMFGKTLKTSNVVGAHFTLGTDVSPSKAKEFEAKSFVPLRKTARKLSININERYQVTDKLVHDMVGLATKEKVDFLLAGAGPKFMMPAKLSVNIPIVGQLQYSSMNLPGELHKDKLESVIARVECPVAVLQDRGFSENPKTEFLILNSADLDVFRVIARNYLGKKINVLLDDSTSQLAEQITSISSELGFMANIKPYNAAFFDKKDLIIMGHQTCKTILKDREQYDSLPSLLIIRL